VAVLAGAPVAVLAGARSKIAIIPVAHVIMTAIVAIKFAFRESVRTAVGQCAPRIITARGELAIQESRRARSRAKILRIVAIRLRRY